MSRTESGQQRANSSRPSRFGRDFLALVAGACAASAFTASSAQAACLPPPPDLDAWYPFDGNGNDLILGKNAVPGSGVTFPNAKVLRGAGVLTPNTYLTVAAGPVLNQGLGDFSIDLWVLVPTIWATNPHVVWTLIDKRAATGGTRGYILFVRDNRLALQLADGTEGNYLQPASSPALPPGWNHLAVTVDRDNSQGVVFYRNGVITSTANPTAHQGNLNNNAPTLFGRNALGLGALNTSTILDEVEFFDRVLKPAEIKAIADAGSDGKCK